MSDSTLNATDFEEFFHALWGNDPFPWQAALAERTLAGGAEPWPPAITLPTAAGKTACLDIAVFALAAQAERQAQRVPPSAPRRIFFVVDRRVIVDEAFERARCMAMRLELAREGILKRVAERLRGLAGGPEELPLACFQLRGGIYRDDSWARSPIQPTIACSTVDQLGSRLLFRAYGRSFKAWHLQAGLVANDSLILLDEAHCAQPFMETLTAVGRYRAWGEQPIPLPFHTVVLSATPPAGTALFPDRATLRADRAHPLLRRRIEATKPTRLVVAQNAQGKDAGKVNQALAERLVAEALALVEDTMARASRGDLPVSLLAPAVVIFCNRVDTARRAHALLTGQFGLNAVLLTGRMRPLDKDDTLAETLALLGANRSTQRQLSEPLYVVSTQALEVGANLDFDLLVTECADLAALRQRFGRLNRLGRPIQARASIVVRADQQDAGAKPDPVYGEALPATWCWLNAQADENREVDMGIAGLEARLPSDLGGFIAASPRAPTMLPAHVDALVQTAPEPYPSPEVALFLHGPRRVSSDVQVCWRADLPELLEDAESGEQTWIDTVGTCPPTAGELMPVPISAFRLWLVGQTDLADGGDVEFAESETPVAAAQVPRMVLRWRGPDDSGVITDPDQVLPGDLLVIPASLGGGEVLGHIPGGAAFDQGDRAQATARAKAVLRLTFGTLAEWPASPWRQALMDLLPEAAQRLEASPEDLIADLRHILAELARLPQGCGEGQTPAWLKTSVAHLSKEQRLDRGIQLHPCGGLVLTSRKRLETARTSTAGFSHEDDAAASGTVTVPLSSHLRGVRAYAERFTPHLPEALAKDVQLAAFCHDLGKADPRFQALLQGGNPWIRWELLAKSGQMPQGRAGHALALLGSGYPSGGRHELLSVRLLESAPRFLDAASDRDLVLHLIASHHGHCRPFAPQVDDPNPREVHVEIDGVTFSASTATGLEQLDSGVAERFWRLVRRYGWWGLAGLEAVMILADHRRSEYEEAHAPGGSNE